MGREGRDGPRGEIPFPLSLGFKLLYLIQCPLWAFCFSLVRPFTSVCFLFNLVDFSGKRGDKQTRNFRTQSRSCSFKKTSNEFL